MLCSPVSQRLKVIQFNDFDGKNGVLRISFQGTYQVENGLPLNPNGRTGMEGRGLLGRWGPNFAGDPLVTRSVVVL